MTKAEVCLIIGNIYLAISLRDKPVTISILSLCYFVCYFVLSLSL